MNSLPNYDDNKYPDVPGRVTRSFILVLSAAANVLLSIMVVLTCIDVIGRYFFAAPLLGAHELITLSMGIMIFLGMPLVTAADEHLTVDIAQKFLSPKGKRVRRIVVNAFAALTFLLFAYLLWLLGDGLAEDFMTTEDLELEQAPLALLMAAMCVLTGFVFLGHVIRDFMPMPPDRSVPSLERD